MNLNNIPPGGRKLKIIPSRRETHAVRLRCLFL